MEGERKNNNKRWYFTREQLENSPSRRFGVDSDKELSYRQQAANLLQDMGQRLNVYPCGLGLRPWSASGHASASRPGTLAGTEVGKAVAGAGRLVGRAHNGAGRTVVRAREVRRSQFPARSPVPPAWLGICTFPVFVLSPLRPSPRSLNSALFQWLLRVSFCKLRKHLTGFTADATSQSVF